MRLELYQFDSCPYCQKVKRCIDEIGIKSKIEYHDTSKDPNAREQLIALNSKTQVPCLVIDGKPMLESDEIITWLKQHFKK